MKEKAISYQKTVQAWCWQHKVASAILLVQGVVLLCFVARLFAPQQVIDLSLDDFSSAEPTAAVTYAQDGLTIQNTAEDTSAVVLNSSAFSLPSGAYQLHVSYQSVTDPDEQAQDINAYTAGVYINSAQTPLPIYQYELLMLLRDSAQQLDGYFWTGLQPSENIITIYYVGAGYANVVSMQLEEQLSWRWMVLFAATLCFVLVDFCLWWGVACVRGRKISGMVDEKQSALGGEVRSISKKIALLCLLCLTLLACLPFLAKDTYDVDDIHFHLARIAAVAAELSNGQFPVRMMSEMMNGYGYVNSLFYCDIFLYFPALLHLCMVPLQLAYKIYAVCVTFCTALLAYVCFGKMAKDAKIGMLGAVLYTLSTYRLSNVYARAAVGEYTAMLFLPLVALGIWQIYHKDKPTWRDWLPLTLGMAGVIQSHVLSVQIVVAFLVLFCLVAWRKTFCVVRVRALLLAALLCAGLTAWFWVPFIESALTIQIAAYENIHTDLSSSGLTLAQLFSLQGYQVDYAYIRGYLGWGLIAGGILALGCLVWRKKINASPEALHKISLLLAFGVLTCLLTLRAFPWDEVANGITPLIGKITNTIQFPWRYLIIATFCFVLVAVLALSLLRHGAARVYRIATAALVVLTLLTTGLYYHTFLPSVETLSWDNLEIMDTLRAGNGEYFMTDIVYTEMYSTKVISSDALVVLDYQKIDGVAYLTCENQSEDAQTVTLPIWDYPHYQAQDTASGETFAVLHGETAKIELSIDAGYQGTIAVAYASPWYWHLAEAISLLCWGFVTLMVVKTRKAKQLVHAA